MSAGPFTANTRPCLPPLASGRGARVVDVEGREYLDFCSQTFNANLGHRHPAVEAAVVHQASRLHTASTRFSSDVALALHTKLIAMTPDPLVAVNLSTGSGTLANECAVKAARKATGKHGVVSWHDSHLGQSHEMMRLSGKHWSRAYLGERRTAFLPAPCCSQCPVGQSPDTCSAECLDDFEAAAAGPPEAGCAIIEPVMVDAGVLTPPPAFHRRLRKLCDDREMALLWDEVQTGFGWLGELFAMDAYGIVPDVVTVGKGLGAGFPLSATLVKRAYDVLSYGEHEVTAGAQPIACAASLAMIRELETTELLDHVRVKGALLRRLLTHTQQRHPCIAEVRGAGLLVGVELRDRDQRPDAALAARVVARLLEEGVFVRANKAGDLGNVLVLKPPLVVTIEDIEEMVEKLDRVLARCR